MDNFDYAGFQQKYGIAVSPEPDPPSGIKALEAAEDDLYYEARDEPKRAIPKLEKLIQEYPDQTPFRNYLFVAYMKSGQRDKAQQTLERTMRQFPNYLFGAVNYVLLKQETSWIVSQGPKLGKNLSLTDWPKRADGTYHTSELLGFERAAIIYLAHLGKFPAAKDRINRLLEFGAEEEDLDVCIKSYQLKMIEKAQQRQQAQKQLTRRAEHIVTTSITSADTQYKLVYPEVEELLEFSLDDMTEENLNTLLALPRESLVADLRKILRAGIAHYLQKYEREDWEDTAINWHAPVTHALYLVGALEATEALPEVLDFLRIDEEAVQDFFGDFPSTYYQPTLFSLTKGQPAVLIDYLLESKNYTFDRTVAQEVLTQIALHFPNQRATVIDGFRQIWQRSLDQPKDQFFTDTFLISCLLGSANTLRATELLPLARELSDRNLIDAIVVSTVEDIEHEFLRPSDPSDRDPQPATPYEYYSEAYRKRRAKSDFPISIEEFTTPLDMILIERMGRMMGHHKLAEDAPSAIPRSVAPGRKVGRNEPCPCGSGKKHKKCCLGR